MVVMNMFIIKLYFENYAFIISDQLLKLKNMD